MSNSPQKIRKKKSWCRNQKLTNQQIKELKTLRNNGVRIHLIAQIIEVEHDMSRSAVYYHLSENKQAYSNKAKKIRALQRGKIQRRISQLIEEGMNTGAIANDWNVPLKTLNKIYTT